VGPCAVVDLIFLENKPKKKVGHEDVMMSSKNHQEET